MDLDNLSSALDIVRDASTSFSQVSKGLEAVKKIFGSSGISKQEVETALADLSTLIADTQVKNAELRLQLSELGNELSEARRIRSDLENYALIETETGSIVYALKDEHLDALPFHYLCPHCVENRHKSILQGSEEYRDCPRCSARYSFNTPKSYF